MNFSKINPWNWFQLEDGQQNQSKTIPISHQSNGHLTESNTKNRLLDHPSSMNALNNLQQRFDAVFDELWSVMKSPSFSQNKSILDSNGVFLPNSTVGDFFTQLDISCDDDKYTIILDVPGLKNSELSIDVYDYKLFIRGRKEDKTKNKGKHYYRVERSYGEFQRALNLPYDVDIDKISAELQDGVLNITLPRLEVSKDNVKNIPIKSKK